MTNELSVTLTPELRLEQAIQQENPETVEKLTIVGAMTDDDFQFIRENMAQTLQVLDMGRASIEGNEFWDYFNDCIGLISAVIPASLVVMYNQVLPKCSHLNSIVVPPENPIFTSEDGVLFDKGKTRLICYPCGRQGDYVIPDTVATIGCFAFSGCIGLTSINLPASLVYVGLYAFADCKCLMEVTIPASVIDIDKSSFPVHTRFVIHPENPLYICKNGVLIEKAFKDVVIELEQHADFKDIVSTESFWKGKVRNVDIEFKRGTNRLGQLIAIVEGVKYQICVMYATELPIMTLIDQLIKYNEFSKLSEIHRCTLSILLSIWCYARNYIYDPSSRTKTIGDYCLSYNVRNKTASVKIEYHDVFEIEDIHNEYNTFDDFISRVYEFLNKKQ